MAKREYLKFKESSKDSLINTAAVSGKVNAFARWSGEALKFILGLIFVLFAYAFTVSFLNEFSGVDGNLRNCFWAGALALLGIHLFVWEPAPVYAFGHKILQALFSFFTPLVKVAPFLLPIYVIVLFAAYGSVLLITGSDASLGFFLFLIGAAISLHLVFSARALRSRKSDPLKAGYIFGFGFVYTINVLLLALLLAVVFSGFSFVDFFTAGLSAAKDIISAIFSQLFVT